MTAMSALPYWLVWAPTGSRPPACRHASVESATAEAERLARAHPGQQFVVLQSVTALRVVDLERIDLMPSRPPPF
ncbi:MAG: hypothetical protein EPN60_15075 [Nevskiaceae bacterium]|nr:MAG: hypothetical protein EPN60_15075 [Nevskiaceae bacterium]